MRIGVTVLCLVLTITLSWAQQYTVTTTLTPSAFQPLAESDNTLQMNWGADDPYSYISLPGDTMSFFGVKYPLDSIGVSYAGNLRFLNANSAVILDAFFTFLDSTHSDAKVKYRISGAPGSRLIVIDWQQVGMPGCPPEVRANFQVVLQQEDGIFTINYGEITPLCDSAFGGGTGPYVGIFRSNKAFSNFFKICWLLGDPLSPKVVAASLPALSGSPISGLSYIFTPPSAKVYGAGAGQSGLKVINDGTTFKIAVAPSSQERSVHVYDMLGRTVAAVKVRPNHTEVVLTTLKKGTYIVRVENEQVVIVR